MVHCKLHRAVDAPPGAGYRAPVEQIMTADGPAHVALDQPQDGPPGFLVALTHGAGGTPDTVDVLAVAAAVRALGAVTALVTQPYRVRGGRAPGSAVRQDDAWCDLIAVLRRETAGPGGALPLVQGGRANGGRGGRRTAARARAGASARRSPLHPRARPDKSRDGELRSAGTSVLVLAGERDPFGVPEADA